MEKYINSIGMTFVSIPGGQFLMGAEDITSDERPVHWVRLSPFWLGETPVTNEQYRVFLEATGHRKPIYWYNPKFFKEKQPVVGVSWHDAIAFCKWLSQKEGKRYCLPSEAQWEFAAKGTDNRQYPWGNEDPDDTRALFGVLEGEPMAVGSFPAGRGPFGTLDQAGNVWEWCQDVWDNKAYEKAYAKWVGAEPVATDGDKYWRVLRGGSYWDVAGYLRCAYRYRDLAEFQTPDIGFRVAAEPEDN